MAAQIVLQRACPRKDQGDVLFVAAERNAVDEYGVGFFTAVSAREQNDEFIAQLLRLLRWL